MVILRRLFVGIWVISSVVAMGDGWRCLGAEPGNTGTPAVVESVSVLVRDKKTNEPMEGIAVEMSKAGKGKTPPTTNAQGLVEISLHGAHNGFNLQVHEDGYVPMIYSIQGAGNPGLPKQVVFDLVQMVSIGGQVVDETGKPLEHATVAVVLRLQRNAAGAIIPMSQSNSSGAARMNIANMGYQKTQTDETGNWSMEGFPRELDVIQMSVTHPMCLSETGGAQFAKFSDTAGLLSKQAKITLTRGTPVDVTVTTPDGDAIPGATVIVGRDRVEKESPRKVVTDDDGKAHFGLKEGADSMVTVMAKGMAPEQQTVKVGKTPVEMKIQMKAGATLAGTVFDQAGKGLGGAIVMVDSWRGTSALPAFVATDNDGHFEWNDAPTDAVVMDVTHAGGFVAKYQISMVAGAENKVTLQWPTWVHGKVTDEETEAAVAKFHVLVGYKSEEKDPVYWDENAENFSGQPMNIQTGAFAFPLMESNPFYRVRVEAEGYLPSESEDFAFDGLPHTFTFKMKKGKPLVGTVTEGGKPAAGAEVFRLSPGRSLQMINGRVPNNVNQGYMMAKTDKDGGFSFPPSDEEYRLIAMTDSGFGEVSGKDATDLPKIELLPWGRIEGNVRIRSKAAGHEKMNAYAMRTQSTMNGPNAMRVYFQNNGETDENGHYVMERVIPGKYGVGRQVEVKASGRSEYVMVASTNVEVEAGKTATADVGGHGRPVVGKLALPASMNGVAWVCWGATIMPPQTPMPFPENYKTLSRAEQNDWNIKWMATEEGKKYLAALQARQEIAHMVPEDSTGGNLRAEEVPPGNYELNVMLVSPDMEQGFNPVGRGIAKFTMPPIAGGDSDEPLDIGAIPIEPLPQNKAATSQPADE